jgi:hypothetical protein
LLVPSEKLRVFRITLLKMTHWPFVVMILGYERGRQFVYARRAAPDAPSSLLRRSRSTHASMLAAGTAEQPFSRQPLAFELGAELPAAAPSETLKGLEQLAANLKAQLEFVNALLEKEKMH